MAVNVSIFSNSNNRSQTVTVDFVSDFLAASVSGISNELQYFFKFTTGARDTANHTLPVKIAESLSDLAIYDANNSAARWRSNINSQAAYADINDMVTDYLYDYIHGHVANQWGSNCGEQPRMKFSS